MATKRRLRLFLRLSLAGTLIGVAYGSFMGRAPSVGPRSSGA